jgi:hypothetical protein
MLPRLRYLVNLRYLKLIGNLPLADERNDFHPLADIRNLHGLEIVSNEVVHDLRPLTHCRKLRQLKVSGYSVLQDLSALAGTSVEHLEVHTLAKTMSGASIDLGTLAGTPVRHLSIQHSDFARGLYSLPADLPLTELRITNRAERRSLLGVARWTSLTRVGVAGLPTPAEVAELGRLPNLRHLDLYDVPEQDVERVDGLDGVTVEVHARW